MKDEQIHDYDRYQPPPRKHSAPVGDYDKHSAPVGDYERYERAARRRELIWGGVGLVFILFLGMLLSRLVSRWLE